MAGADDVFDLVVCVVFFQIEGVPVFSSCLRNCARLATM